MPRSIATALAILEGLLILAVGAAGLTAAMLALSRYANPLQ